MTVTTIVLVNVLLTDDGDGHYNSSVSKCSVNEGDYNSSVKVTMLTDDGDNNRWRWLQ